MKKNILYIFLATLFPLIFSYVYFTYPITLENFDDTFKVFDLHACFGIGQEIYKYINFFLRPDIVFGSFFGFSCLAIAYLFYKYLFSDIDNKQKRLFALLLSIYTFVCVIIFSVTFIHRDGGNLAGFICTSSVPVTARVAN